MIGIGGGQWRIHTRKGGGLNYTLFIFNLELSSMAGGKNQGGLRGAPMEFPGARGLEPPSPLLDPPLVVDPLFVYENKVADENDTSGTI